MPGGTQFVKRGSGIEYQSSAMRKEEGVYEGGTSQAFLQGWAGSGKCLLPGRPCHHRRPWPCWEQPSSLRQEWGSLELLLLLLHWTRQRVRGQQIWPGGESQQTSSCPPSSRLLHDFKSGLRISCLSSGLRDARLVFCADVAGCLSFGGGRQGGREEAGRAVESNTMIGRGGSPLAAIMTVEKGAREHFAEAAAFQKAG